MKNLFLTLLAVICISAPALAIEITTDSTNFSNKEVKIQVNKINTKRLLIANALLLTDAQKLKANSIYNKSSEKEAILYLQLNQEKKLLQDLSKQKANFAEKKAQRKIINNIEKNIKSIQKESDKDFKSILNYSQKLKYNKLKKEIQISNL